MLPFFTDPYPDELLYSAIARYHFYSGNVTFTATTRELFLSKSVIASVEIGSRFSTLVEQIGSGYSVENLLAKHTVYPYYAPFLLRQRQEDVLENVKGKGYGLYERLGMTAGGINKNKNLYYCPHCATADIEKYGEPYIHRGHQLQGIEYCAHHEGKLKKYPVNASTRCRFEYIRFDKRIMDLSCFQVLSESEEYMSLQVKLAKMANQILDLPLNHFSGEEINQKYRALLYQRNLMNGSKRVKIKELYDVFLDSFPEDFLRKHSSSIDASKNDDWLKEITRNSKNLIHPFRHLLMIHFLEQDIRAFIQGDVNSRVNFNFKETPKKSIVPDKERIENYRAIIKEEMENSSDCTRTQLLEKYSSKYRYLLENDKAWFDENIPKKRNKIQPKQLIDWDARDREYCRKIKILNKNLMQLKKPVRITRTIIGRKLNILTDIEKRISKLPHTNKLLNEILESVPDFEIRRCHKLIDQMLEENILISLSRFEKIASIKWERLQEIRPQLESYIQMKKNMEKKREETYL